MDETQEVKLVSALDNERKLLLTTCLMPPEKRNPTWRYETCLWDRHAGRCLELTNHGPNQQMAIAYHLGKLNVQT